MIQYRIKRFSNLNTVTVYHTTRIENLPGIMKEGLLLKYQKDRDFENKSLGLNLTKDPIIYLSKDINHLCIPAVENKRVVLQIHIPSDIFKKWDRENKGDPMYSWFLRNKSRFQGSFKNFILWEMEEMRKQDPRLDQKAKEEIKEYGSLENTPRFKHALGSSIAMSPEYCLYIHENIPPQWIDEKIITESQLKQRGIFFGR